MTKSTLDLYCVLDFGRINLGIASNFSFNIAQNLKNAGVFIIPNIIACAYP